jgi:integrase
MEHTSTDDLAALQTVGTGLAAMDLAGRALEMAGLAAAAAGYARGSKAPNTRRAYRSDWEHFSGWCARAGLQALPADPSTVCLYLTAHAAELKVSTLRRRLACLGQAHRAEGHASPGASPAVRAVWAGIARAHAQPPRRKTPLVVDAMRACLDELDEGTRDVRDRAILLVAWGGALRRSEVVALRRRDIAVEDRGMVLTVRRGKTDQLGEGRQIGLPFGRRAEYCPVRAYMRWAVLLPPGDGPLFVAVGDRGTLGRAALADRHVARLVKRVADQAGLVGDYSGHSLRAGFATAAAAAGASERSIMAQTGHKSLIIARGYIRPAQLFDDNAAAVAAL